ncbi:hypothetical protein C7401_13658 [Paraburkholderia unamae]|uniref:hypothetical protein n=1 Tax=Paraburkholderia unamae TaxID=219649 RepID=UPI000DC25B75|nr:hypothetical protein [Paraburkholderia unamae]RAR51698.1 hypothetical protein C7401_13658 [Paraburkholderia unamae]
MKRMLLIAAGLVASIAFAGCTSQAQQTIESLASNAQGKVLKACGLVQPALLDLSALVPADPNLKKLADDNGKLCAAVAQLDATNAKSLVDTVIPQAIGLVSLLPLDAATATAIKLALGAASIALSNWLDVYGAPVQTAAPAAASGASEASAPLAASSAS